MAFSKCVARQNVARLEILPHHIDNAAAAIHRHAYMVGIRRRDGGCAGQRHAQAASASEAMVDAVPIVMQKPGERAMQASMSFHSCSLMLPAQRSVQNFQRSVPLPRALSLVVAPQHGAGRQVDGWQVHADRAHEQAGSGFVAAAHQHRAIDRKAAQILLGVHRQQIAIEHRAGLHVGFGDGERGDLDREAAGRPDAAFDGFGALPQVRVTGIDFAPGVEDGDDRLADEIFVAHAELLHARAMAEAPLCRWSKPTGATQLVRGNFFWTWKSNDRTMAARLPYHSAPSPKTRCLAD